MKESLLKILESKIKGEVHNEKHFKKFYSVDSSSYQIIPQIIVIPINEEDVIKTIKIAKWDFSLTIVIFFWSPKCYVIKMLFESKWFTVKSTTWPQKTFRNCWKVHWFKFRIKHVYSIVFTHVWFGTWFSELFSHSQKIFRIKKCTFETIVPQSPWTFLINRNVFCNKGVFL